MGILNSIWLMVRGCPLLVRFIRKTPTAWWKSTMIWFVLHFLSRLKRCIFTMSVQQLLLILPVPTCLWQERLTQTGGSRSCVLPKWCPKVLNSFLPCYSFCKDVEELSSGTFFSLFFLSVVHIPSSHCWLFFFFLQSKPLQVHFNALSCCWFLLLKDSRWTLIFTDLLPR